MIGLRSNEKPTICDKLTLNVCLVQYIFLISSMNTVKCYYQLSASPPITQQLSLQKYAWWPYLPGGALPLPANSVQVHPTIYNVLVSLSLSIPLSIHRSCRNDPYGSVMPPNIRKLPFEMGVKVCNYLANGTDLNSSFLHFQSSINSTSKVSKLLPLSAYPPYTINPLIVSTIMTIQYSNNKQCDACVGKVWVC